MSRADRAHVERHGPGSEAKGLEPGDFLLAHGTGVFPRLIEAGQRVRFRGDQRRYAHWSHSALVVDSGAVVEAEASGVRQSPLSKYRDREYHAVRLSGIGADGRRVAAEFALAHVGDAFGYAEMAAAGLSLLTGRSVVLERRAHMICSVLVGRALELEGIELDRDVRRLLPADLAREFDIRP